MESTRESLISMDGEIFLLPQYDNDNKRRFISDDNTYILALDGDTDFHPKAVVLLVDRSGMGISSYTYCCGSRITLSYIAKHKKVIIYYLIL